MQFHEPAGWIPPQFREFIQQELTDEEVAAIRSQMGYYDEAGHFHRYTDQQIREMVKKNVGVRDTRTGEASMASGTVPIMGINL